MDAVVLSPGDQPGQHDGVGGSVTHWRGGEGRGGEGRGGEGRGGEGRGGEGRGRGGKGRGGGEKEEMNSVAINTQHLMMS